MNNKEQIDEESEKPKKRESISFLFTLIGAALVVVVFVNFIMKPISVVGSSMHPTLKDGAKGFTNVLNLNMSGIQRFDIVVFQSPTVKGEFWVKRVIALPGETIYGKDGIVYVNDVPLDESVIQLSKDVVTEDFSKIFVPEESYFVMGDNRDVSFDSRKSDVGPILKSSIIGKDILVVFPFSEFGYEK